MRTRLGSFVAASLLLACVSQAWGDDAPKSYTVTIAEGAFKPESLVVRPGDTVEWKNADLVPHTATLTGKFDSGRIKPGKSWKLAITAPLGKLDYVCTYHPNMKGSLQVQ